MRLGLDGQEGRGVSSGWGIISSVRYLIGLLKRNRPLSWVVDLRTDEPLKVSEGVKD